MTTTTCRRRPRRRQHVYDGGSAKTSKTAKTTTMTNKMSNDNHPFLMTAVRILFFLLLSGARSVQRPRQPGICPRSGSLTHGNPSTSSASRTRAPCLRISSKHCRRVRRVALRWNPVHPAERAGSRLVGPIHGHQLLRRPERRTSPN